MCGVVGRGVAVVAQVVGAQRIDADQQEITLPQIERAPGLLGRSGLAGGVRGALGWAERVAVDRILGRDRHDQGRELHARGRRAAHAR